MQADPNSIKLPTRKLGKHGPEVGAIGFGLMGLSFAYGPPKPDEERYALLDHIFASGCRNWDSAATKLPNFVLAV